MDSDAFVQFAPIKNPTDILSFSLILFKILLRCSHCFNFDDVATSSLPTGKNFLIYVCGSSSESSKLFLLLATFSPLITDHLLVTSPLTVFMVIVVLLPFMLNLFSNLSKMKVHYLKLSKSAYVFIVSPVHSLNHNDTTHILSTSVPVFNDAHAATLPTFLSLLVSLLHWY